MVPLDNRVSSKRLPSSFVFKPSSPSTLVMVNVYFRQCHAVVNTYDFFLFDLEKVPGVYTDVNDG